jgi:hypothetical protein
VFLAPDDADNSEGIVGEVWQKNQVLVQRLPELKATSTADEIATYAQMANMPEWWIRDRLAKKKPCPQMLCGIPIEVDNRLWGVLVLDSRRSDTIDYQSQAWPAFTLLVALSLEELLKRV